MKQLFFLLLISITLISCDNGPHHPNHGIWRVSLDIGNGRELPFLAEFPQDHTFVFLNAEERVVTEETIIRGDSIIIQHPVFEGVFKGRFTAETISGDFIKPSLDRVVPFTMKYGDSLRFQTNESPGQEVEGMWETVFSPGDPAARYIAKGIFRQEGSSVTGTFRTTTGDYRFLDGVVDGDTLRLSTFDTAHAFLFKAKVTDSTLDGMFYSGNHFVEPFVAKRNTNYELPEEDELTFLKDGYDTIEFSFPDTAGDTVSLADERFLNKVVVVQIMGSWCPNCLDETRYYTDYFNNSYSRDLEFVSLAFEYAPTRQKAMVAINRLKQKVGVPYPILLAQFGTESKLEANMKLPMLNHVLAYPTTIFIDKKGMVRRIHTGFNGPATGDKYTEFKQDFEAYVESLLSE
ncbi:TlpA family protein disulfide reductase [Aureitalea sp. L0-47]|uniref:peroxiredoxin family protein n=1 Tax=Aureitalea sp. L0-47 TaxID=2816962 RepID=UPI002238A4F2|nr:TlpA disulfide reductase family protein [Aureitalea sp. L0-47]MCW5519583.1 TlpA family protein disulfide reductase [Aureitalea sp. L0-47]